MSFLLTLLHHFFYLFDSLAVCPLVVLTFYSCLVVTGQACPPCVRQLITDVIRWKPQACGAQPCAISLSSQTSSSFSPSAIIDLQKYPLIYILSTFFAMEMSTSTHGYDIRPCLRSFALKFKFVKNIPGHQMVISFESLTMWHR